MDIDFVLDYNLLVQVDGYQARTNHIFIHPDQQQLDIFCKRYGPGSTMKKNLLSKAVVDFYNITINEFNSKEDVININFQTSNRLML